jgi:hydrogenase maturation protease
MPAREMRKRPTPVGRLVIIGVGNPYRRDDAAGLLVARRLRERAPREVAVLEQDGEPASLIAAWENADAVIIVDAASSGSAPGTLHVIDAGKVPLGRDLFRHSTHAFGVAEAVELAKTLGKLPPVVRVYGIEGKDFADGTELSPEVLDGVEGATAAVLALITDLGFNPSND